MTDLEEKLKRAYVANGITADKQASIDVYLRLLANKDPATYSHSIRVGILASEISEFLHLDSKALLYAGLLHDVGKALVNTETLTKTEGFGEKDYEEIKHHPNFSYRLLRGIHNFSADIAIRHHRYQTGAYPENLPEYNLPYSMATRSTIDFYAMVLSLADFYDAATMRVNDKHGEKRKLSKEELKSLMFDKHPHFRKLIGELYRNGILEDEEIALTEAQKEIEQKVNQKGTSYSPQSIRRNIQLALALEPLSEKPGCTTRSRDCSRHLKLEYFIAGAINVGDAFEEMAIRLQSSRGQPKIYDLALKAQLDSKKNRAGGRVNAGMIEMLAPIIAAQIIYDKNRVKPIEELLQYTTDILKNAADDDVKNLVALKRVSYDMCAYDDRAVSSYGAKTVFEFYQKELAGSERPVSRLHNSEILGGFPVSKKIFQIISNKPEEDLSERVRDAYLSIRKNEHKELVNSGLTADLCGIALYMLFSQYPEIVIVR